jgi:hypothetical protein
MTPLPLIIDISMMMIMPPFSLPLLCHAVIYYCLCHYDIDAIIDITPLLIISPLAAIIDIDYAIDYAITPLRY